MLAADDPRQHDKGAGPRLAVGAVHQVRGLPEHAAGAVLCGQAVQRAIPQTSTAGGLAYAQGLSGASEDGGTGVPRAREGGARPPPVALAAGEFLAQVLCRLNPGYWLDQAHRP